MCSEKSFGSKRNQVKLCKDGLVEKQFTDADGANRERKIYLMLAGAKLRTPRFVSQSGNTLLLSYESAESFAEILDDQERKGQLDYCPWKTLADWLTGFYACTGLIQGDMNLRNFLYDPEKQAVIGLDFEDCGEGRPEEMAASVMAFILLQDPPESEIKKDIISYLIKYFVSVLTCTSGELECLMDREMERLKIRRKMKKTYGCMLLVGGEGSRMGYMDKRKLKCGGTTLGEAAEKLLESLGMPCFLSIANYPCSEKKGWVIVRDHVVTSDGRYIGPLGGLLTCLEEAEKRGLKGLFVASCDMPFLHLEQLTLLRPYADEGYDAALWRTGDGRVHPVCAYYSVSVTGLIRSMAEAGNYCLRELIASVNTRIIDTKSEQISDCWFANVNTREEYGRLFRETGKNSPASV